ncbi:7750_t:CDS:2 [Rhizophagus irregularis]|nr:7750_t:CDS:2 [Rhizophagus irregularis]
MRNLRRIQYDCEEAMSAFEGLQIKSSIYLPIDIRLTVNEDCYDRNLASNIVLVNLGKDSLIASLNGTLNIHNTKTSLTSAENQLNQQSMDVE